MEYLDLTGKWTLADADRTIAAPANVPGCVHTDLETAGYIPDPYYRDNEDGLQWIGRTDWVYERTFKVTDSFLAVRRLKLRCEGLDTLSEIRLNGILLGKTDNMFRSWEFDVKKHLRPGKNQIQIVFRAAVPFVEEKQSDHPMNSFNGGSWIAYDGAAYLRKQQCNFGWDWAPRLVTCGIWKRIGIVGIGSGRIQDVHVRQTHRRKTADLEIRIAAGDRMAGEKLVAETALYFGEERLYRKRLPVSRNLCTHLIKVRNPMLWWPNGMGNQNLHRLEIRLLDSQGNEVDSRVRRIGLREIRLVREKDTVGESFYFTCNSQPFFAKGANWVPADTFPARVGTKWYQTLLQAARDSHYNMIRVWGGGFYESEDFYDLCDELGICVWQDFMFACSTYPTYDREWMKNVESEARENIRRIRRHACLALWCGNNELEQGLVGKAWSEKTMSWADYSALFIKLLSRLVRKYDPDTAYWRSSPHTPGPRLSPHNDPRSGDAHVWSVWFGGKTFESYFECEHRFNSEFGFQSFPEPKTVASYTLPEDRNITHPVMEHHQRSGNGNVKIASFLFRYFRMPKDFESTLWMSQIQQADAIQTAVEAFRSKSPRCMGTLFWQHNDCWPVASWSGIDYFGRWKATQFAVKRAYRPLIVTAVEPSPNLVDVGTVSDLPARARGELKWHVVSTDGTWYEQGSRKVTILPQCGSKVHELDLSWVLNEIGRDNCILFLRLVTEGGFGSVGKVLLFGPPKRYSLRNPNARFTVKKMTDCKFTIEVKVDRPALWCRLYLEDTNVRFSDNFFHISPHDPVSVTLVTNENTSLRKIKSTLRLQSLIDLYGPENAV